MAAFVTMAKVNSCGATRWPEKPKIFIMWPFTQNISQPLIYDNELFATKEKYEICNDNH